LNSDNFFSSSFDADIETALTIVNSKDLYRIVTLIGALLRTSWDRICSGTHPDSRHQGGVVIGTVMPLAKVGVPFTPLRMPPMNNLAMSSCLI